VQGSCAEILATATSEGHRLGSGYYYITAKEKDRRTKKWGKKKLKVWCDMESDGGGYTMLPITNGLLTSKNTEPNSCARFGMQMAVPRSKAHFRAMLLAFGRKYFKVVPGVYVCCCSLLLATCLLVLSRSSFHLHCTTHDSLTPYLVSPLTSLLCCHQPNQPGTAWRQATTAPSP